jgi:hypothetical protein
MGGQRLSYSATGGNKVVTRFATPCAGSKSRLDADGHGHFQGRPFERSLWRGGRYAWLR